MLLLSLLSFVSCDRLQAETDSQGRHKPLLLHPVDGACFADQEGISVSFALSTSTFEDASRRLAIMFINGEEVSRLVLQADNPNHLNIHVKLPHLADGDYLVTLEIFGGTEDQGGRERAQVKFGIDAVGGCQEIEASEFGIEADKDMQAQNHGHTGYMLVAEDSDKQACRTGGNRLQHQGGSCNVAFQKPSMQSSTESDHVAKHAVDGISGLGRDGELASSRTRREASPWWMVDFGRDVTVQSLSVSRELLVRGYISSDVGEGVMPDYPQVSRDDNSPCLTITGFRTDGTLSWHAAMDAQDDHAIFEVGGGVMRIVMVTAACIDCSLGISEVQAMSEGCWDCARHCIRGKCGAGDACSCEPDWFGNDCSKMIMTTSSYSPSPQQLTSWVNDQADTWFDAAQFDRALSKIVQNQNPRDCSSAKVGKFLIPFLPCDSRCLIHIS